MTTPYVQYGYASGSGNTVRPTEVTYPDGREIALDYGSAGSMADALSRVGSLIDATTLSWPTTPTSGNAHSSPATWRSPT